MSERPFTSTSFQQYLAEHRLMATRCGTCGALHLPPRPLCPSCFGEAISWEEMSGSGHLKAFTTIHIAPTAMIEAGYGRNNPYCTGVVELDEGPAISAQILGVDASHPQGIAVGIRLSVTFVERGQGDGRHTLLGFQPAVG
jgi:hypothetical protein